MGRALNETPDRVTDGGEFRRKGFFTVGIEEGQDRVGGRGGGARIRRRRAKDGRERQRQEEDGTSAAAAAGGWRGSVRDREKRDLAFSKRRQRLSAYLCGGGLLVNRKSAVWTLTRSTASADRHDVRRTTVLVAIIVMAAVVVVFLARARVPVWRPTRNDFGG